MKKLPRVYAFCHAGFFLPVLLLIILSGLSPLYAGQAVLSWTPDTVDPDLAGINVYHKDDSNTLNLTKIHYTTKTVLGPRETSVTMTGLGEGTHYFALSAFDHSGNESILTEVVHKGIGVSTVSGDIKTVSREQSASIAWRTDKLTKSRLEYRRMTETPSETYFVSNDIFQHDHTLILTQLDPDTPYIFRVFNEDGMGNASSSIDQSFTTKSMSSPFLDTAPPGDIEDFTAQAGNRQVTLLFTGPSEEDLKGLVIRYRTDRRPEHINDGYLLASIDLIPGKRTFLTHTGLDNSKSYYYFAASHDRKGNYRSTVFSEATPSSGLSSRNDIGGSGCGWLNLRDGRPPGPGASAEMIALFGITFVLFLKSAFREVESKSREALLGALPKKGLFFKA